MKKRYFAATAALLCTGLVSVLFPFTARADVTAPAYGYVLDFTGMCIDAANAFGNAVPANGSFNVQLWACNALGGEDQRFAMVSVPGTTTDFMIQYQAPGGPYCLAENTEGAQAVIQGCATSGNVTSQTWTRSGNEYVNGSGNVLDVKAAVSKDGAPVILYPSHEGINQQFMLPF